MMRRRYSAATCAAIDEAADEITERHRYLIPHPPLVNAHLGAKQHAGRNNEHVDDGVLESQREEGEDRQPGRGDLSHGGSRRHRHDHAETNQPVAEDGFDEDTDHSGRAATPAGSIFPILVRLIARRAPKAMLPSRFPRNTHDQFAMMAFQVALPSSRASGSSPKLPVTSSSPSSTIITRLTGKISAPTSG